MSLSLTKYIEYFDEDTQTWKPLIWYSNRECSLYESQKQGGMVSHDHISVENIPSLDCEIRGIPEDVSDFVRDKLESCPNKLCGVTYYYLSEIVEIEEREEELLRSDISKGVTFQFYDRNGENPLEMRAYTIGQLKRIHNLFTFLVYDIHGFIPDEQIRVIFYYGQE